VPRDPPGSTFVHRVEKGEHRTEDTVIEGLLRLLMLVWMPHRIKKFRLSANIIDCAEGYRHLQRRNELNGGILAANSGANPFHLRTLTVSSCRCFGPICDLCDLLFESSSLLQRRVDLRTPIRRHAHTPTRFPRCLGLTIL
jgi:hypothetical protein